MPASAQGDCRKSEQENPRLGKPRQVQKAFITTLLDVSATHAHQAMWLPSIRSFYVQARAQHYSHRRKFIQE
jgi:hypothetical protein